MQIDGPFPTHPLSAARKSQDKKKVKEFKISHGSGNVRGNDDAASLSGVSGLDALLSLQQIDQELFPCARGIDRGNALLSALDQLQRDLLRGDFSLDYLMTVSRALKKEPRHHANENLDRLIQEIELRLAVEIAKIERYGP